MKERGVQTQTMVYECFDALGFVRGKSSDKNPTKQKTKSEKIQAELADDLIKKKNMENKLKKLNDDINTKDKIIVKN